MSHSSHHRYEAIKEINSRQPRAFNFEKDEQGNPARISSYFGVNVFDLPKMKQKLSKDIYANLLSTIHQGKSLDPSIANTVANAIKEWALSQGVTHFCHWFQPQTGSTAEKHDAFLSFDDNQEAVEKFSGSQLIQSEPDASSFPSGGMRTTFEARGYTAWDPSSPVFILEHTNGKTLCIPSVFISYHGDALDEKTGLLRSAEMLSQKACELLELIGDKNIKRVVPTLGIEQEYFLIDRAFYHLRPDLIMSGRTLLGGQPPKGQQLEDHYFGSIPSRVASCMSEVEHELYKLGVPIKTRHNEVAPSQFETAPIFEEANIASDHNQLVMEVLRKVARKHNFTVLLHEKPFAGINGSGKHCNWSMAITNSGDQLEGENLLEPGKTPHQNIRFLLMLAGVLKGVHKHAGLLRAGISSSGNDHRLGANEAPPAIISVFLGNMLSQILDEIEKGVQGKNIDAAVLKLGVSKLPEVMKDNTDRNRTSPFAFTGNKFEFRAVGSSASTAFPITLLNAAVADGFAILTETLKSKGVTDANILDTIKDFVKETKSIRFEGNNYSQEWVAEADKRTLPHLRKTPEALMQITSESSLKMLTQMGVFTEAEVKSRFHVRLERYIKNLLIEVDTLGSMVDSQILPSGYAYHSQLAQGAQASMAVGAEAPQLEMMKKVAHLLSSLTQKRQRLEIEVKKLDQLSGEESKAHHLAHQVSDVMQEVRGECDELEAIISDNFWPLPKYREMLFIS